MRRTLLTISLGASLLLVTPAGANPVSSQILRARQVPATTHVQITYGTMSKDTPQELKRDTTVLAPSWTALAGFTANTGSGLTSIAAQQFCDCNVAVGTHRYEVKITGPTAPSLSATLDVVKDYTLPAPKDLGVGRDLNAWDIPEPSELQGLDCTKQCTGAGGDGGAKADGGTKPVESDSGCSLGGRPLGTSLLLLAAGLLLGALLARRRR